MPHRVLNGVAAAIGGYTTFKGLEILYHYASNSESAQTLYERTAQQDLLGPANNLAILVNSNPLSAGVLYTIGGLALASLAYVSHRHHKKHYVRRKHV